MSLGVDSLLVFSDRCNSFDSLNLTRISTQHRCSAVLNVVREGADTRLYESVSGELISDIPAYIYALQV